VSKATKNLCEQLIHAKRLEGLYHVSPYVTEYEVLESIESYWNRFEVNTEYEVLESIELYWSPNNTYKIYSESENEEIYLKEKFENNKEKNFSNSPLPLMPRLETFLDNSDFNVLILLGDSGLGKSLSTYLFAAQQLNKCWTYLNLNTADTEKPPYLPLLIRPAVETIE